MTDGVLSAADGSEGDGHGCWQYVSIEGERQAGGEVLTLGVRRPRAHWDWSSHGHGLRRDQSLRGREVGDCAGIIVAQRWRHADGRCGECLDGWVDEIKLKVERCDKGGRKEVGGSGMGGGG